MASRFAPVEKIRSDGFVETWKATDGRSGEEALLRHTVRTGNLTLDDRIGHRFQTESAVFARRNFPGFPAVLEVGFDGGAWIVRPWIEERETDPERLLSEGAEALATLHGANVWHLNLHSGNALRGSLGLMLTDPGMARDWVRDGGLVLPDPNPAPEQRTPEGRRGGWTDVWRLAATARTLGHPETDVLRRALQEDPVHRYPDAAALRDALEGAKGAKRSFALGALDQQLVKLNQFSYERRACPACNGVLTEPKPLPKGHCPVCREGRVQKRALNPLLCPVCHSGVLKPSVSADPPAACPRCTMGRLRVRKNKAKCSNCDLELVREGDKWSNGEQALSSAEWRRATDRTEIVLLCDGCDAQFDVLPDGRRKKIVGPSDMAEILTTLESARLAAFAPIDGGDAVCSICSAEYAVEPDAITLLAYYDDPFGFAEANRGRRLPKRFMAREAMGLGDPNVQTVCEICALKMAAPRDYLTELRDTDHAALRPCLGQARTLEDWHRLAQGLPPESEKDAFDAIVERAMRRAYLTGELGFDFSTSILWRGAGTFKGKKVAVTVSDSRIELRRGIRRTRIALDAFWAGRAEGNRLVLLRTGNGKLEVEIAPRDLPVDLQSGRRIVHLEARDLAARLGREMAAGHKEPRPAAHNA
ncbi:hypothetical protein BH11ARM2_BH11ARM2_02450 [soil metagenome]